MWGVSFNLQDWKRRAHAVQIRKLSILKYTKKEEQVAVTLNKNIQMCGKILYQTGISDVYVVLIENGEKFLDNEKLQLTNYEESTIYEAELRRALNSLELSTDALYRDINYRICQVQRQQINISQTMLRRQMETQLQQRKNPLQPC